VARSVAKATLSIFVTPVFSIKATLATLATLCRVCGHTPSATLVSYLLTQKNQV
jgi:hypothetical protein